MEKILVSACLMGDLVRYDGHHQQLAHRQLAQWQKQALLVKVCPEVAGGLPIPRIPAEIHGKTQTVITQQGVNVTEAFNIGANVALSLCKKHAIKFALLKESSPSCGSHLVYDGSFCGHKIKGAGITTQLLKQHNIKVYSENQIEELIQDYRELCR